MQVRLMHFNLVYKACQDSLL